MTALGLLAGFCLLSVWCVTVLCVADVFLDFAALGVLSRRLREVEQGVIVEGLGEGRVLAEHVVEQRARPLDGQLPTLGLWDCVVRTSVSGGVVEVRGERLEVPAQTSGEVWPSSIDQRAARELAVVEQREALLRDARGGVVQVVTSLRVGQQVWVAGVRGGRQQQVFLSAIDPLAWVRSRRLLCVGFGALGLAWASLGTFLCFAGTPWGLVAKLGAAVLLGLFLGLTPLCVRVRDACKTPRDHRLDGEVSVNPAGLARSAV